MLVFTISYAQQQPNYTLYRYNMNLVNPAYAGALGYANITTNYRAQWSSIEGAPETLSFFYSQPVSEYLGLGISVINDKVFAENRTGFNIDFSYQLEFDNASLFFGIKAGGSTYNIDRSLLSSAAQADPAINNIDEGFKPNIGAGIYYKHNDFFISVSTPNVLSNKRIDNNGTLLTQATEEPHIYTAAGYNIYINEAIELRPSVMMRYVRSIPTSVDFTAAMRFHNRLELGAMYRTDKALGGFFLLKIQDWLDVGYAYDSALEQEISTYSNGTHELMLRFHINNDTRR